MEAELARAKKEARERARENARAEKDAALVRENEKLEVQLRLAAGLGELFIMRRLVQEGARPDGADAHGG